MADTEKYAVELSIEPHMPAGPFLVGGNTGFHPFGLLYIILNIFFCFFFPLCFFQVGSIKVEELEKLTRLNFQRKEDVRRKFNDVQMKCILLITFVYL